MALDSKVIAFKKHFNIESEIKNVEFCLVKKNNLIAKFGDREYILNNQRNKNKFLTYKTMNFAKKYGNEFLRTIKLEAFKQNNIVKRFTPSKQKKGGLGYLYYGGYVGLDSYVFSVERSPIDIKLLLSLGDIIYDDDDNYRMEYKILVCENYFPINISTYKNKIPIEPFDDLLKF